MILLNLIIKKALTINIQIFMKIFLLLILSISHHSSKETPNYDPEQIKEF
jgi:hypothetical protein